MSRSRVLRMYWVCALAIGLGSIALLCVALRGTLLADDWDHYAMQRHIYPVEVQPWDMFRFVGESAAEKQPLFDSGRLPWWSSSNLHLAVFRPLSSLLVYADLAWFNGKDHPWWMHLHSLLWWVVLLAAVALLYRRFLSFPVAVLSLLVFAVDDAHVFPVVWIANRSEVVSIALVCWAIWAHVAAESHPEPLKLRIVAATLVGLALLAGEHAIAPLCYVLTFELARDRRRWAEAARRLLPYVVLTLTYLIWRSALGYGVSGSAFYVDPIGEPSRYLQTAAIRVPLLAADLMFGIASDWWFWGYPFIDRLKEVLPAEWVEPSQLQALQVGFGVAALVVMIGGLYWGYRVSRKSPRARACWALSLAGAMSLVPLAGTASMTRLTVVPAIAFDAAIASGVYWLVRRFVWNKGTRRRIVLGTAIATILWTHIARPAMLSAEGAAYLTNSSHLEYGYTTKAKFGSQDVTRRHVFVISAHDMASQYLMPYLFDAARLPVPLTAHMLSPAAKNSHVLTRVAANVLDILFPEPVDGNAFTPMVYRQSGTGFFPGQTFQNSTFEVEVKMVRGVQPRHLRFTFQAPLEDPRYLFMYPTKKGIEPIELPALGESIRLEPPAWPQ